MQQKQYFAEWQRKKRAEIKNKLTQTNELL